jgi:1-acyl-sn-glycerol-3-phosphate acyltransferase
MSESAPASPPNSPAESPQVGRDRNTALGVTILVCLALPSLALLVLDVLDAQRMERAAWFAGTGLFAALLPFLYWAPYRALGIVPYAAIGWTAVVAHGVYWHEWPGWAHGLALGLIVGALARGRRGEGTPQELAGLLAAVGVGFGLAKVFLDRGRPFDALEWFLFVLAAGLVGWSWVRFFRPAFEMTLEPVAWVLYAIRGAGPGLDEFPRTGPCLVIANHACWFDPLFLAKVIPRPITPMMTARFYDLPIMQRLMVAFGVIRVPEKALRKDAPELQEAIAALDRGECVVIFPEGYLRRTEDRPLRRFGQGVWQILKARPNTPVFAAWVEGGWGSYTSYANGAPTKNKKKDFRHPIGVGMSAAITVPPELLNEHLNTRVYLMNLVSDARQHLELEPLPAFKLPEKPDETDDD